MKGTGEFECSAKESCSCSRTAEELGRVACGERHSEGVAYGLGPRLSHTLRYGPAIVVEGRGRTIGLCGGGGGGGGGVAVGGV